LGLPDINGAEVLDNLKKSLSTRHIPVHIISSEDKDKDKMVMSLGAVGYSTKPTTEEEVNNVLHDLINFSDKKEKPVLVIENDPVQQDAIAELLDYDGIVIYKALNGEEAKNLYPTKTWSCVILDLHLDDISGMELLKHFSKDKNQSPPFVVNTSEEISKEEFKEINKYTNKVIIKSVNSPERLLREVSMFLHSIESTLSPERKQMINLVNDPNASLKGKSVLVVDDDTRNIFTMVDLLESVGMVVTSAENGVEGIEKLKSEENIDIVLMDIMMPIMDGYQAMTEIRKLKEYKKLPIIALTAKAMPEDRAKCINAGASDYLTKPIVEQTLFTLIRIWVNSSK
jgi:CheY-like chemotaxis protein